jgi:ABC-2 type transport system permease protein
VNFWLPVLALWRREMLRFAREKGRVLGFVGSPLVFWLLIGSGFGDLAFFFPGALVLTVMFSAVFSTMSLIEDRREGFLRSMLVSPAPRSSMVLGKVLGASTLAWVQGLLFLCFLPMTGYAPGAAGVAAAAAVLFLVSFAFTALGFFIAWQMDSTQGFHAVMNLVLFPLWLISGALFPMAKAHGWVQWLMRLNPLTYALAALRAPIAHPPEGAGPAFSTSLAVTACFAAALLVGSAVVANRGSARSI